MSDCNSVPTFWDRIKDNDRVIELQGITRAAISGLLPIDDSMCRDKLFDTLKGDADGLTGSYSGPEVRLEEVQCGGLSWTPAYFLHASGPLQRCAQLRPLDLAVYRA